MMPITMNLSSERKQSMMSLLTTITLALALVSPAYGGMEWDFNTGGTPADAIITPGAHTTGWHNMSTAPWSTFGVPGVVSGLWDSGSAGSIMLSGLSGSGPMTLTVFQWVETQSGGSAITTALYNGNLTYALSASPSQFFSLSPVLPVTGTGWYEYSAALGSLTPGETITIKAPAGGAIINNLTLVPEPATLIAGAVLLVPFALSTWPILRRRRSN
jgi:hypothetical protein